MPRLRLTAQHVDTLPAVGGKRTDYADAIVPGLVLRVSPGPGGAPLGGPRSWSVLTSRGHGRAGRRTVRVTLGKTRRLSLQAARNEARTVLESGDAPTTSLTVRTLVERALKDAYLAPVTKYEWERLAKFDIYPALGERAAADVQRADVRAFLKEIGHRSHSVANKVHGLLARVYSWAVAEELLKVSPLVGFQKLYPEAERDRVLSPEELRRLLGALARLHDDWAQCDVVRLLLLTGVRKSAALGVRRSELQDLDGEEPLWVVPPDRSKRRRTSQQANQPHYVPLSPQAVAVMKRRISQVDDRLGASFDHLFPAGGHFAGEDRAPHWSTDFVPILHEEMRAVTDDLQPAAPDPNWHLHDLRTTIATLLVEQLGVAVTVADLILGHRLPGSKMTRKYIRAQLLPERRTALSRWADWLERLAEPGRQARVLHGRW